MVEPYAFPALHGVGHFNSTDTRVLNIAKLHDETCIGLDVMQRNKVTARPFSCHDRFKYTQLVDLVEIPLAHLVERFPLMQKVRGSIIACDLLRVH